MRPRLFLHIHLRNNLGTAKDKLNSQAIFKRDGCAWLIVKRKGTAQQRAWEIIRENSLWECHTWGWDFAYLNDLFGHKNKYSFKNHLELASSVSFKRVLRSDVVLFYNYKKMFWVGLSLCFEKQPSHSICNGKL